MHEEPHEVYSWEYVSNYGITHFIIVDDELTLKYAHTTEICNEILKRNLKITFEGQTRADLVNEEIMRLLVKTGLIRISFGMETTDPVIRETIKKKVPFEAHSTANSLVHRMGIEADVSLMLGLPGDTRETVLKTIEDVANDRMIKQVNFSIATPYPGTELFHMALNGNHGLFVTTTDYSQYRRYGSAVMGSKELSPDDLLKLQNYGFSRIYSKPWRWGVVFRKFGVMGIMLQTHRYFTSKAWRIQTAMK